MELAGGLPPEFRALIRDGVMPDAARVEAFLQRCSPAQLTALDEGLGLERSESFREYVARVDPGFEFHAWTDPLFDALQAIADGRENRLIVEAPPRHGKSHIVSIRFPAYYLERHPHRWAALGSHGHSLAKKLSRSARNFYRRGGGLLDREQRAVEEWATRDGGGLWITSPDSSGTGRGASLFVIDDPVKSRKAIRTPAARRDLIEWYDDVVYTRLESTGAVVIMATRWGDEDLTGQVIKKEGDDEEDSERWLMLSRPALALPPEDRAKFPESIRVIPDTRAVGEALAPERGYTVERLRRIERVVGPATWWTLFQQQPRDRDGTMFAWDDFKTVHARHATAFRLRGWDLAGTEGGGDWTVGALISYDPDAPIPIIIEDIARFQHGPGLREAEMVRVAQQDAIRYGMLGVVQWWEQDTGTAGEDRNRSLMAAMAGFDARYGPATGDKKVRATPIAGQVKVGNVGLYHGPWVNDFKTEACAFLAGGAHDDQVDAVAHAFNRIFEFSDYVEDVEEFTPR
jgi:predicted phage terminase large subunit-like protein